MRARIFQIPKAATQSGTAKVGEWGLDFPQATREVNDPLMGWCGGGSTREQLHLHFPSRDAAIAYAEANGIEYEIEIAPKPRAITPKVYAENFRYGRAENWTH